LSLKAAPYDTTVTASPPAAEALLGMIASQLW
jgi:hypothetical protein